MSNSRRNYIESLRYFGKDLTNVERSQSITNKRGELSNHDQKGSDYLKNYAHKLRERYNLGLKNHVKKNKVKIQQNIRSQRSLTMKSKRSISSRAIQNSKQMNKKNIKKNSKEILITNKNNDYFVSKQLKSVVFNNTNFNALNGKNLNLMELRNSNSSFGSEKNLKQNSNQLKNNINGKSYGKVEKLISEYLVKTKKPRKNMKMMKSLDRNFHSKKNSFQIDNLLHKSGNRKKESKAILEKMLKEKQNKKSSLKKQARKKSKSFKLTHIKMPNLLDASSSSEEEMNFDDFNLLSEKKTYFLIEEKSPFRLEMMKYELNFQEPGYDFSEMRELHLPNIWNFLIKQKVILISLTI